MSRGNIKTIRAGRARLGAKRQHHWHDLVADTWHERAGWATQAEAVDVCEHVESLTRLAHLRYRAYPCSCGQWHIRRTRGHRRQSQQRTA